VDDGRSGREKSSVAITSRKMPNPILKARSGMRSASSGPMKNAPGTVAAASRSPVRTSTRPRRTYVTEPLTALSSTTTSEVAAAAAGGNL
jgi:hypothetical protein